MNALGVALVWCAVQVTLIGLLVAGLYWLTRWWRPAAAAPVVLAGLSTIVALSVWVASPWPRWPILEISQPGESAAERPAPQPTAESAADAAEAEANADPPSPLLLPLVRRAAPTSPPTESTAPAAAPSLARRWPVPQALLEPPADAGAAWRWPAVVAAVLLTTVAGGLAWLTLGLLALRRQRQSSHPVDDRPLCELIDVLCAELNCRQPIDVRQSDTLVTAALVGWRRPTLLLPPDWPTWSAEERRAVLAHEIAHARGHDCLAALCGQMALMLHWYHPLLHWLAGRLRLEQELAADAAAARICGGQQPYLMTIARLALRQSERPLSWPARSFLPTRSTFLRRIAMLRDNRLPEGQPSRAARLVAVAAVLLGGLAVAGLRGPGGSSSALAAERPRGAAADKGLTKLSYVAQASPDKRSIAGAGHAVAFKRPAAAKYLAAVQIYASRYGAPQPPQEDFHVYVLDGNHKVLHDFLFPYALIARGPETWYRLALPPTEVPEEFVIALAFNPHQTKGIYLGLDRNVERSHSLVGLPGQGFTPAAEKFDWMIEALLAPTAKAATAPKDAPLGRRAPAAAQTPPNLATANIAVTVKTAVETLSTLAETNPQVARVLETIRALNAEQVAPELVKHLASNEANVRRAAIYLLWQGQLSSIEPAVDPLLKLCQHEEDTTRGMAAIALGANRIARSYPVLIKLTSGDPSGYTRRCAAYALGLLGNKDAVETLQKALTDPESLVRANAQMALRMLQQPPHRQESFNEIQPDGQIRFRGPLVIRNDTAKDKTAERFVNSDFVHIAKITDAQGKLVAFEAQHDGDIFRYRIPLDPPLAPGKELVLTTSGTTTSLVKPGAEPGTFVYQMRHFPAVSGNTLRIETYLLPAGAELIDKSPADLKQSIKDGCVELRIERTIPAGGSLEVTFRYRLPPGANEHADAQQKAQAAAEAWLALVDAGKYGESWDAAAEYFKRAVTKETLAKSLEGVRAPLGQLKSRELSAARFATRLPGAPDGEYVVLQFKTSMTHAESVVETVTPMLDKDGQWRVSGYYVK